MTTGERLMAATTELEFGDLQDGSEISLVISIGGEHGPMIWFNASKLRSVQAADLCCALVRAVRGVLPQAAVVSSPASQGEAG
jgi:hypothetical protein